MCGLLITEYGRALAKRSVGTNISQPTQLDHNIHRLTWMLTTTISRTYVTDLFQSLLHPTLRSALESLTNGEEILMIIPLLAKHTI